MIDLRNSPPRPPLFVLLFVSLFGFIGVTVLISLWTADGFGAPPLVFRVFGSFVALGFIIVGFGVPLSALMKRRRAGGGVHDQSDSYRTGRRASSYDCPHCGANAGDSDVSPSGDIKCDYCGQWWNIHRQSQDSPY
jgi:hypothetical protein